MRVLDTGVCNSQFVKMADPPFEVRAIHTAEADVVQSYPELAELFGAGLLVVLMDAEQCAAIEEPDQVPKSGISVLVEDWVAFEQRFVPRAAGVDVADR